MIKNLKIPRVTKVNFYPISSVVLAVVLLIALILIARYRTEVAGIASIEQKNKEVSTELSKLKSEDQYKINKDLETRIGSIEKSYKKSAEVYERIQDLKDQKKDTKAYEALLVESLSLLSQRNYASADAVLATIEKNITQDAAKSSVLTSVGNPSVNAPVNNTPPGSGYSRQKVKTDFGEFTVDIVASDLNSTRVIVDTASDSDCRDNCPVLSLGDYVSRSGAFAGINGSYFCPASYPSCAGKTNSFDTLLMNKNKKYFNSDNNIYSTVPAVIFSGGSARFVTQSLQWGRDTGVDSVLANQPLLVLDGNVVFGGDDEVKRAGAGSRSFVGSSGSTAYIGVVHGVNAAQMARVLQVMGIKNALNLDSGGSTALWSGGYKVGPGRAIPNAILFVRK